MIKRLVGLMLSILFIFSCCACEKENIPQSETSQISETEHKDDENNKSANQYINQKESEVLCEVFGRNGYYLESEVYPDWYRRSYFFDGASNIPAAICEGFVIDDYHLDIDNDGVKEILCNRVAGGDGHRELYVYKYNQGKIYIGYVNWLEKDVPNLFYWGCNAVQTKYDNDKNAVIILYGTKDTKGNINTTSKEVSFDWIEFTEWDGKTRPFIEISKAYELYGEILCLSGGDLAL